MTTIEPRMEIERADPMGQYRWVPVMPDAEIEREYRRLVREVGQWGADNDSDIEGRPSYPPAIRAKVDRIEQIEPQIGRMRVPEGDHVLLRSYGAVYVEVRLAVAHRPKDRRVILTVRELSRGPHGGVVHGPEIGANKDWHSEETIREAARQWAGTGDARETIYADAVGLLDAAAKRIEVV